MAASVPELAAAAPRKPPTGAPAYSKRDLWLDSVAVNGDAVRFPEELAPISDALAEVLARPEAGGYRVIARQQVAALWSAAQAGRLPGVEVMCDAQPSPMWLSRFVYRGASFTATRIDCPPPEKGTTVPAPCLLDLTVLTPRPTTADPRRSAQTAHFHARLPPGETPERWAERLRATGLASGPAPSVGGGLGLVGFMGDPAEAPRLRVAVTDVHLSSNWNGPISDATFKDQTAALETCTRTPTVWRDNWLQPYVIEINQTGIVDRCEPYFPDHLAQPEFRCVCDLIRAKAFGAGPPHRRAELTLLVDRPRPQLPKDGLERDVSVDGVRSTDPTATITETQFDATALTQCLGPIKSAIGEHRVAVRLTAGPDGRVRDPRTKWPSALPADARRCLDAELTRTRFNCPASGAAVVDARLTISVTR